MRRLCSGLIPAYAGRTEELAGIIDPDGAHPRLRGADLAPKCHVDEAWGSSPLTRGGLRGATQVVIVGGLIPAYAGRTTWTIDRAKKAGAHPRLRGADTNRYLCRSFLEGSSGADRRVGGDY
ncbi:conserved hypothetical protein [Corynebacterium striatum]|nr:conserved hypothetical protein [Corynebacterium striatum]